MQNLKSVLPVNAEVGFDCFILQAVHIKFFFFSEDLVTRLGFRHILATTR